MAFAEARPLGDHHVPWFVRVLWLLGRRDLLFINRILCVQWTQGKHVLHFPADGNTTPFLARKQCKGIYGNETNLAKITPGSRFQHIGSADPLVKATFDPKYFSKTIGTC